MVHLRQSSDGWLTCVRAVICGKLDARLLMGCKLGVRAVTGCILGVRLLMGCILVVRDVMGFILRIKAVLDGILVSGQQWIEYLVLEWCELHT